MEDSVPACNLLSSQLNDLRLDSLEILVGSPNVLRLFVDTSSEVRLVISKT